MRIGPLRNRLLIERPTIMDDSLGAPAKEWSEVVTVQAKIEFMRGREYFGAQRSDLAEVTTRIFIREVPGQTLGPEMRGTDQDTGAIYDFVAMLPSDHREMITIAAKSGSRVP